MKKIIASIFFLMSTVFIWSQSSSSDLNEISLTAYIPEQTERVPSYARSLLLSKLDQMITINGVTGDVNDPRFIITSKITTLTKDITATAPSMFALNLEFTLFLGDGITGRLFSSKAISLKGVGTNENKAYINAVRKLNPRNKSLQNFLTDGKRKIIDYYNTNCEIILKKTDALEKENKFKEALSILVSIPKSSSCYAKVKSKIRPLYIKMINFECEKKLSKAKSIWVTKKSYDTANKAAAILAKIDPNASCFNEVEDLYSSIERRVQIKQYPDRKLSHQLKEISEGTPVAEAVKEINTSNPISIKQTLDNTTEGWN